MVKDRITCTIVGRVASKGNDLPKDAADGDVGLFIVNVPADSKQKMQIAKRFGKAEGLEIVSWGLFDRDLAAAPMLDLWYHQRVPIVRYTKRTYGDDGGEKELA